MKKRHKISIYYLALFVFLASIATAYFFYWRDIKISQIEAVETSNELDQLKIVEDQVKNLVAAASSTLKEEDKKDVSVRYNTRFGILMYHHINYKARRLSVKPEIFDAQIKYLLDQGYKFIKLSEAFKTFAAATSSVPYDKTLVLTFDDGYRDFYLNAYPILKKYNVPASFYVINQDIGKIGNVTWEMIKSLHQDGLVEIGVHTVNHLTLGKQKPAVAFAQMSKSKELLEKGLNDKIDTIVYPFGSFNQSVKQQAKAIGFIGAASVYFGDRPSGKDLYAWRRVMITNSDVGPLLLRKLFIGFEIIK